MTNVAQDNSKPADEAPWHWSCGMQFIPEPDRDVHLDDEKTVAAVFSLYDKDRQSGAVIDNPRLLALLAKIFPSRDVSGAHYFHHQAGDWTKGITVEFLIEGDWDGEHVVDAFRFDPWATELRNACRTTRRRVEGALKLPDFDDLSAPSKGKGKKRVRRGGEAQ